ncbi:unnamed protein product [Mytilus edulis]|uniref:Uncharacterized protein n=1 Tax=Mytilus edulis TaxID=6550 RepID=A0A8S3PR34_MYTED|nr:unnamed protein product [Mytilus edulis]
MSPQKAASAPHYQPSSQENIRSSQDASGFKIAATSPHHEPSSTEQNRSTQDVYGFPQKKQSGLYRMSMEVHTKLHLTQAVYHHLWLQIGLFRMFMDLSKKSNLIQALYHLYQTKLGLYMMFYGSPQGAASYEAVPSSPDKYDLYKMFVDLTEAASYVRKAVDHPHPDKLSPIQDVYGSPPEAASYLSREPSSQLDKDKIHTRYKIRSIQDVYGSPQEAASYLSRVPSSQDKIRSTQDVYGSQQEIESYPSRVSSSPDKIRSIQDVYGSPQKMSSSQGSVPSSLDKIRSIQDLSGYQQKAASVKDDIGAKSYISDDNISVHSILSITHKSTTSKSDLASVQSRGSFTVKSGESVKSYDDFIDNDSN